ncbi:MAG: SRPBCC family protein [Allosphingosinicella sp.]
MATVQVETVLEACAAEAWALVGDYGAAAELAPGFATACRLDGDDRIVTFASGVVARERLVTLDPDRRRLVYSGRSGRADHHNAVMEVIALDGGRSLLRWTTDILPDALAPLVGGMMEDGAAAISRRFASQPVEVSA